MNIITFGTCLIITIRNRFNDPLSVVRIVVGTVRHIVSTFYVYYDHKLCCSDVQRCRIEIMIMIILRLKLRYKNPRYRTLIILETLLDTTETCVLIYIADAISTQPRGLHKIPFDRNAIEIYIIIFTCMFTFARYQASR